jgi:H+/gluconate symporter-like permease
MVVLGVLLLVAAGAVALSGVLANLGSAHALTDSFSIFGYEIEGSTGRLFLYGVIVGAVGAIGLGLLVAGLSRGMRHRVATRRELRRVQREREALKQENDQLAHRLDDERSRADTHHIPVQNDAAAAPPPPPAASPPPAAPVVETPVDRSGTVHRTVK